MAKLILDIQDLHKSFGHLEVLKGVNLKIHEGEVVCIIGPSGAGKSTLLRCINRLEEPTKGKIFIDGVEITGRKVNLNKIRSEIGMVFQHFNLFPHLTALENCTLGLIKVKKMRKEEARKKAELELLLKESR